MVSGQTLQFWIYSWIQGLNLKYILCEISKYMNINIIDGFLAISTLVVLLDRMAISRSYPRHLVKFRENESFHLLLLKKMQLFYNSHFFIVLILFSSKKSHFLFIHIISFILWIIHPNIRPDICPDICPDIRPDICPNIRLDIRWSSETLTLLAINMLFLEVFWTQNTFWFFFKLFVGL